MFTTLKMFKKWWFSWKTIPVLSWVQAARYYRAKNFARAQYYYEKGLRCHPTHPARFHARLDLVHCLFKTGHLISAKEHLEYVAIHTPELRETHIRLIRLHMWIGDSLAAAQAAQYAMEHIKTDAELVALLLIVVLENGGPEDLLNDTISTLLALPSKELDIPILEVARACLALYKGDRVQGRAVLSAVASQLNAPFEAHLYFGAALLREGKVGSAQARLRKALRIEPNHPTLLALLAETYLQPGEGYNPIFARQQATIACQRAGWLHPRALHTLAESYYHVGDKVSALIIASKAKDVGDQHGCYREADSLNQLIETLSTGTLA